MTALRITLAWPPRQLSPNGRIHHMERYRFKKAAKDTAYWVTRAEMGAKFGPTFTKAEHDGKSDVPIKIIAHPIAGKVRPDDDNLLASCKAALDGIALGLGINDRFFRPTGIEWAEPVPNGKVIVEVTL